MAELNLIQKIRKARKLTQKELAEKSGLSLMSIRRYESGERQPKYDQLKEIASALDVPVFDLLEMDEDERNGALLVDGIITTEKELLRNFNALNFSGKAEAIKRVAELKFIPQYTEEEDLPFN